jgi:polyribonucleotide nucleotidyltransferase
MLQALDEAHRIFRVICEMQDELVRKAGKPKKEYVLADYSALRDRLTQAYLGELKAAKAIGTKQDRGQAVKALRERAKAEVAPTEPAFGFKPAWRSGRCAS